MNKSVDETRLRAPRTLAKRREHDEAARLLREGCIRLDTVGEHLRRAGHPAKQVDALLTQLRLGDRPVVGPETLTVVDDPKYRSI